MGSQDYIVHINRARYHNLVGCDNATETLVVGISHLLLESPFRLTNRIEG